MFAAATGYRWLVCANGHYSFVTPLAPGAIFDDERRVSYRGRKFTLFDRSTATVQAVYGEFYWKVRVGERVQTADFIAPPAMLSREKSDSELHWSFGVYLTEADVRSAFKLDKLPSVASGVAAHQPFRFAGWTRVAVALLVALLVCVVIRAVMADDDTVYSDTFNAPPSGTPAGEKTRIFFSQPFRLKGNRNVAVDLSMPLDNEWAYATVDLVNEATGEVRSYGRELAYYWGVAEGVSWSEGRREDTHVFSAGLGGSHVLRLEIETAAGAMVPVQVNVRENVFPYDQLGLVVFLLGAPGALLLLLNYVFERVRWSNSDHAPAHYREG
jgi:hypothetical protein